MAHTKTRHIYDKALKYEKLYKAWNTVYHTCKNQQGKFEFALYAHARIAKILDELKRRAYFPNKYRCFMIFEPKPRLVMSQSIRDKVVNHFVAKEYLIPILEKSLIDANVATREGKGSSYAGKLLRKYFAQMKAERPGARIYALKVDVSKYFYSIDHKILLEKLERKIKDPDVIEILRRIINETNGAYINKAIDKFNQWYKTKIPHYEQGKGLSIGAMTSQFLAIFYLNDVDHYIKEELGCRFFIRYMDDFLILSHDKGELYVILDKIRVKLAELKLEVNPKSTVYNCNAGGFSFLGYRYYIDERGRLRVVCLARTVRRIRRRLATLMVVNFEKRGRSYESYRGFFLQGCPVRVIEWYV